MTETVLNLKRAKHTLRLDGSEDSPTFTLDLTTDAVQEASAALYNYWSVIDADEASDEDMAEAFKWTISMLLGDDAWKIVKEWVTRGDESLSDYDIALLVAPLANYLIDQVNSVMNLNQRQSFAKYLGGQHEAEIV